MDLGLERARVPFSLEQHLARDQVEVRVDHRDEIMIRLAAVTRAVELDTNKAKLPIRLRLELIASPGALYRIQIDEQAAPFNTGGGLNVATCDGHGLSDDPQGAIGIVGQQGYLKAHQRIRVTDADGLHFTYSRQLAGGASTHRTTVRGQEYLKRFHISEDLALLEGSHSVISLHDCTTAQAE